MQDLEDLLVRLRLQLQAVGRRSFVAVWLVVVVRVLWMVVWEEEEEEEEEGRLMNA